MGRHNGKKRRGGVGGGAGVTVVGDVVDVDGMGSTTLSSSLFSFLSLFFFPFHSIRFFPFFGFFSLIFSLTHSLSVLMHKEPAMQSSSASSSSSLYSLQTSILRAVHLNFFAEGASLLL